MSVRINYVNVYMLGFKEYKADYVMFDLILYILWQQNLFIELNVYLVYSIKQRNLLIDLNKQHYEKINGCVNR